ncbi:anhydro-N-acetylmuramic acid kinase [Rhodoferax sp. GW822-FHT02A01]|uniref:anhydro-N-acetylmuramic acid kinase n=1 Tax=Rhodoferax sp. GW822-FHT02A01 TaxID=3141537 RepID=UPI00315CB781
MSDLYIGLMSGTSLDGVDGVLVDFSSVQPRVLSHATQGFDDRFRAELLQLNTSGPDELHRAALAANELARVYALVVKRLLETTGTQPAQVRAVGAHGQTVRHRPQQFDGTGYTLQLNQPGLLAELCGMDVVADFRSRDVAAGGQGAPLVPPFHQALFGQLPGVTAVLNIGGISNLSLLNASGAGSLIGFDCGPGNALMDAWSQTHTRQAFDAEGRWAAAGTVHAGLLQSLLSEPFLALPAPKSTGRDLFNGPWLQAHLQSFAHVSAQDVQATLTELTAQACADSLLKQAPDCKRLIVCGGGALNTHLMSRLRALLPGCDVASSAVHGLPPLQVEATAFAWLARQCLERQTGSVQSVTGARGARILGAIYPA